MDAATAAAVSDPDRKRWFRRRWSEPTPIRKTARPPTRDPDQTLVQIGSALREQWRQQQAAESDK
jgi:hypothetical protein